MGFSETMKALSDPVRREILNLLKGGSMTAGDIAERFDMTGATVSYHLSQGEERHLLQSQRLRAGGSAALEPEPEGSGGT